MSASAAPWSPRPAFVLAGLTALLFAAAPAAQSKRAFSHDDYDDWKSIRSTTYSVDGKWMAYAVNPAWGDGVLEVREVDGDTVHRHDRGSSPAFSSNGRYLVFTVNKSKIAERRKKIAELHEKGKVSEEKSEGTQASRRAEMARRFGGQRGRRGRRGGGGGGRSGGQGELAVLDLETGKVEMIGKVKGSRMPEEAALLIYHLDKPEEKKDDAKKKEEGAQKVGATKGEGAGKEGTAKQAEGAEKKAAEKKAAVEPPAEESREERRQRFREGRGGGQRGAGRRSGRGRGGSGRGRGAEESGDDDSSDPLEKKRKDGTVLVVRNLEDGTEKRYENVVSYGLTGKKGAWLYLHVSKKKQDDKVDYGLHAIRLATGDKFTLVKGAADFSGFTADKEGTVLAFTSNLEDFAAEKPKSDIYLWNFSPKPARRILYSDRDGIPDGKVLGRSGLGFSKDGSILTFSVQGENDELPKILPDEKVTLDLWHWQDGEIQPAQAKSRGRGNNSSWSCVYHLEDDRITVLGDDKIPSVRLITPDGARGLATDSKPYQKAQQWDTTYSDVYLVNTMDGSRTKVLEKLRGRASASPTGRYLTWFGSDYNWHSLEVACLKQRNLTEGLSIHFDRSDDDHPSPNPAHGTTGWTKDDKEVVINDAFDLWRINPEDGEAVCITDGLGRANNIRFREFSMNWEEDYLPDTLWLTASNTETMAQGVYKDSLHELRKPERIVWMDKSIGSITKPKKADRFFFTLQTFREYPDVWTSKTDFSDQKKLTNVGKQVDQYRWGNAELVRWVSTGGVPLKGILVKPEGFDPKKKYPMMVHFYEKMSSRLHRFTSPTPGTSPNAAYYVSNGYLWFMPDIVYEVGYPGDSCLKCVVSGVQAVMAQGCVDGKAIGAAGHSWGGYQTAYLVTRTDIFAAVESGAPVSNMVSAYGGIRYQSGRSRQFQYEQTQSRIGGTLWEYPMRYWENSPIFFADKVNTPVLILHNDQDGAVPWTNGIEYFMALRRLDKETYLFNYVGEPHGLRKRQNQKDWSRRMSEYFAHHLKGQPAPKWMTDGVPYHERDREKLRYVPSLLEASVSPPVGDPGGN